MPGEVEAELLEVLAQGVQVVEVLAGEPLLLPQVLRER
jgi:hypothetical protein